MSGSRRHPSPPVRTAIALALASLLAMLASSGVAQAKASSPQSSNRAAAGNRLTAVSPRRKTRRLRHGSQRSHGTTTTQGTTPPEATDPAPAPATPATSPTPTPSPSPAPAPAPAPAPTPQTPAPSSDVLFKGARLRDFWLNQSAPGAITEVPDPAGSGQNVFKFTVGDSDMLNITPNPRAELLSPHNITAGSEFWWSAKVFLPADFPASTPNFVNLLQGPYGEPWVGSPPFLIKVEGGSLKWQRNTTYNWDVPWEVPLVRNRWVSFMIHERFGSDGWLEMWVDGKPITFFSGGSYNPNHVAATQHLAMKTMDSSNNAQPNSIYLQSYRKKGMFPSLTVYHGPLTIGKTRASVEG